MVTAQTEACFNSPHGRAFDLIDRMQILRFAASFVWADCEVVDAEREFLSNLARELAIDEEPSGRAELESLMREPPRPDSVDPNEVRALALADAVRQTALRAIAADGHVDDAEMRMFELLDDLLPRNDPHTEVALTRPSGPHDPRASP